MKAWRRVLAVFLAISMLISMDAVSLLAAPVDYENETPDIDTASENSICEDEVSTGVSSEMLTFNVGDTNARPGEDFEVAVSIENNPGLLGTTLKVTYDEGLVLNGADNGEVFSYMDLQKPGSYRTGCRFSWDAQDCRDEDIKDGTILKLKFRVKDTATKGEKLAVSIEVSKDDTFDVELVSIDSVVKNGTVLVLDYTPGDVNDDGVVNSLDVVLVRRFIVGGYDVEIIEDAADVNNDLNINSADVTLMRRYIAGGYNVVLKPSVKTKCDHTKVYTAAKAASCTEIGNSEFWYCSQCEKYYSDEAGKKEISLESTVIPATGHTVVVDPAVAATPTSPGLTEGSHCSVCNTVIVPQNKIDANYFTITYDVANGDEFITSLNVENKNPTAIIKGGEVYLDDLSAKGYQFLGWFDASEGGTRIQKIENADHNYRLYAHWKDIQYTIQFKSDLVNADSVKYISSEGKVLPSLSLDGYTFAGWSDDDGKIVKKIAPGTTGNITLYANWISDRNQAWAKKKLDDPIIYENDETILFAYEIGEVKNVPIDVIEDFGKINNSGVSQTVKKTYSSTTSETLMNQYTKMIAASTTDSSAWTLSKDWSNTTSVNQEYCEENKLTEAEAESISKSNTGEYYVSSSKGGSTTTTTISTVEEYDLHTITDSNTSYHEDGSDTKDERDTTHEVHLDAKLGFGKTSLLKTLDIGGSAETTKKHSEGSYDKNSNTHVGETTDQDGAITHTTDSASSTASWNSESGYKSSSTNSSNNTVSTELSKAISQKTGYGQSYVEGGGESSSQGLTQTSSSSDDYSNAVTYSTSTSEATEVSYSTTNTKTGYHRWVMAGTAHVFGVVGYDIATSSYFVYTYSIMDDERHKFEDYSYNTASYDDNENGIIDFNIPFEINDLVCARVLATDGLQIDLDGTVTGYEGEDSYVVIPDYFSVTNKDNGKNTVIKVTGISSEAFRDNEKITGIELSNHITEIPDNAFAGCKNLWSFYSGSINSIGENAFKGDKFLNTWKLGTDLETLGTGAFSSAYEIEINAANPDVVKKVVESGAKVITVDLEDMDGTLDNTTLEIPEGTESFTLNGYGKSFDNLIIKSGAKKTVINRVNITSDGIIPLQLDSEKVGLYQTTVTNSGICMALKADNVELDVYGTSNLSSADSTAVLCKNCSIVRSTSGLATRINMSGDWACYSEPTGKSFLSFSKGSIRTIATSEFNGILNSVKVKFDANGGVCAESERAVEIGTDIGELPKPQKTDAYFMGWYTEAEGGNKIVDTTKITTYKTLYAHWAELANPRKNESGKSVWDCIYFGSYPQGEVVTSAENYNQLYATRYLNEGDLIVDSTLYQILSNTEFDANGLASITYNGKTETFKRMEQKDAIYAAPGTDGYYQWADNIQYHYFMFEPIKWRVLNKNGNDALVVADKVIEDVQYNEEEEDTSWADCDVRAWLNGNGGISSSNSRLYPYSSFINTAFTQDAKNAIKLTKIVTDKNSQTNVLGGNDTQDKIFLLSVGDMMNENYGFSADASEHAYSRATKSTLYAKARGAFGSRGTGWFAGCSTWNLRTPGKTKKNIAYVNTEGPLNINSSCSVAGISMGTRPALYLDLSCDVWSDAGCVTTQ